MAPRTDSDTEELQDQEELQGQMSFLDHLEELRTRIFRVLIGVTVTFFLCWYYADDLFRFVSRPIQRAGAELNALTVTEGFALELKLALLAAIFLSSPYIMAQVWGFISPGLYKHERRYALPFIFFSSVLFVLGGVFAYTVAFPMAVNFLIGFSKDMGLTTLIGASSYFDLFIMVELALGVVFEIPAIIFVLSRIGLVSGPFLLKNTKYAVLLSFVIAAIITPTPDAMTMMVVAVPMVALYMVGVVIAYIFARKRRSDD